MIDEISLECFIYFCVFVQFAEPDRTGSSKKRRITRKQSEAETATKRRKATARRNTNTGNMPVQINSNISGTYHILYFILFVYSFNLCRRRV